MTAPASDRRQNVIAQARQLLEQKPVFLDTETTGLDKFAEIVDISIVDTDGSVLFESLVRPTKPIPADVTRIHHITDAMVSKAPTWPVIWPEVRSCLVGRVLAIYNQEFDVRMMKQTHMVYRLPWREMLKTQCIMQLYARFRGEWDPRHMSYRLFSLDAAGKQSNITLPNSHRATADSLLARALLFYMAEADKSPAGSPQ
jgi:DNA polymerase-3 subunit epsilon